jgi:hypothetical protein
VLAIGNRRRDQPVLTVVAIDLRGCHVLIVGPTESHDASRSFVPVAVVAISRWYSWLILVNVDSV